MTLYCNILLSVCWRTYLRRERPPSCVRAIRVAQIRGCTRSFLARFPSKFAYVHLERAMPMGFFWCKCVAEYLLMSGAGCGATCAPVSSAPLRGRAKLSRVPPPSRAHPRYSGRCLCRRAAVSGFFSSPLQTRQGTARAHTSCVSILIDEIIMRTLRTVLSSQGRDPKSVMNLFYFLPSPLALY